MEFLGRFAQRRVVLLHEVPANLILRKVCSAAGGGLRGATRGDSVGVGNVGEIAVGSHIERRLAWRGVECQRETMMWE